jgi:uncharacterized phage protein (TIGR01671 family)
VRETVFRGKRKDNGEWVYGDLIWACTGEKFIVTSHLAEFANESIYEWLEIEPETAGQDTGLKDKNIRKIFDGDILYWNRGFDMYSAVEYQNGSFWSGETLLVDSLEEEVVGNIYENADLIAEV